MAMSELERLADFDPQKVPVTHIDTDLRPLAPEQMSQGYVRMRFQNGSQNWYHEQWNQGLFRFAVWRQAAVLLPLVDRGGELFVLLTRRSQHLKSHAGQIGFPGGKVEPQDANAVETALRETCEEIGLAPQLVETLGTLPKCRTGTAFEITPAVGLVQALPELKLQQSEVDEAFMVPLAYLMTPANHRWHAFERQKKDGSTVVWRWLSIAYEQQGQHYFIWGATAEILRGLYWFLRAE